jgi:hypothetical protein
LRGFVAPSAEIDGAAANNFSSFPFSFGGIIVSSRSGANVPIWQPLQMRLILRSTAPSWASTSAFPVLGVSVMDAGRQFRALEQIQAAAIAMLR